MDLSMATCNAERASMKSSEYRKVIKPLLERRRRARINNCLDELKALILETAQPENTDASKLEKADILELTVQHLRNLRHGRRPWAPVKTEQQQEEGLRGPVPHGVDKFRAGFAECAHEVSSFICALNGVETEVKSRLVSHLAHCVNRMSPTSTPPTSAPQPNTTLPVPAPHQHMDNTQFCRVPVMTPTPPPSPVSPLTPCGTPTTNHISSRDYLIPVSPVSQPESAPYHHHHHQQQQHLHQNHQHGHYGSFIRNNFVRGDVYVWPDVVRSVSRSSSVDTPNSYEDCYSDREESVAPISPASSTSYGSSYRPVMEVHFQAKSEEKPWRPW